MTIWQMSAWKLIFAGGPLMVPILLCSFFAIAIIIEKFLYFASIAGNNAKLKQTVFGCLKANNIKEAINACEASATPLAKILKSGIIKFGFSRDEIKESMEAVSLAEIPKIERKIKALAVIANISPLLGLLGTATGMAGSFRAVETHAHSLNPLTRGDLAVGIWEALITTIAGLVVAIPAYLTYNYFVSRASDIILEMEQGATELLSLLLQISETTTAKQENRQIEI